MPHPSVRFDSTPTMRLAIGILAKGPAAGDGCGPQLGRPRPDQPRRKNVLRRELHREVTALGDIAILEEDKGRLEMRVARLETGIAWAEDPPLRRRHIIGNLVTAPLENGEVEAKTAFLLYRSHLETDHQLLSGSREDALRNVNGGWRVRRRTIVLDANVLLDKNLSVFL